MIAGISLSSPCPIKNLLNSRLVDPIDATFAGDDEIFVRMPFSVSLTIRYRL